MDPLTITIIAVAIVAVAAVVVSEVRQRPYRGPRGTAGEELEKEQALQREQDRATSASADLGDRFQVRYRTGTDSKRPPPRR